MSAIKPEVSALFSLPHFLQDLAQIINIDSGPDAAGAAGCRKIADFFAGRFLQLDYDVQISLYGEDQRPLLTARSPGALRRGQRPCEFLLLGHLDTVFAAGTAAARPFALDETAVRAFALDETAARPFALDETAARAFAPDETAARPFALDETAVRAFAPDEAEGKAYGPGTVDMKAGALLILYLAEALARTTPDISLCVCLNSDEETGSAGSADSLAALGRCARRAFIFEGGRKHDQFVNQRRGCAKYELSAHGIAAHAGTAAAQGASAIVEMAHFIEKLDKLKRWDKGTSINVGLVHGGTALNVVPDLCTAKVEVRYTEAKEFVRVESAMQKLAERPYVEGAHVEVSRLSHYPPVKLTAGTQKLMDQIAACVAGREEELLKWPLEFVSAGGLSDANRLAVCDIPIIDGCGPGGGFPHSEKEFLSLETVPRRFKLMHCILSSLNAAGEAGDGR